MSGLDLEIETDGPGGVAVVRAEGEIDLSNADRLADALASESLRQASTVVLDLLGVPFMDSSGLRELLHGRNELEAELVVVLQPGSPVLRLLELAEVSEKIRIFPSVEAAREGVGPGGERPH